MRDASKLVVEFETPAFSASVTAWVNGCCDVDVLPVGAGSGASWHGEYRATGDALAALDHVFRMLPDVPY